MWDLPFNSHRYFIEPLGGLHARNILYSRYVTFVQSAKKSTKMTVQMLLQMVKDDMQTVTGKNIRLISDELETDDIFNVKKNFVKQKLKFAPAHPDDEWKIQFSREITNLKQNVLLLDDNENGQFTSEELSEILNYLSTV